MPASLVPAPTASPEQDLGSLSSRTGGAEGSFSCVPRSCKRGGSVDSINIPDTLDLRIRWFLNRWAWRGEDLVVRGELEALIKWAIEKEEEPTCDRLTLES